MEKVKQMGAELLPINRGLSHVLQELQRSQEQLVRFKAHASQVLSTATHDLRQPIGVVLAYSQLLLDEAGETLSPQHREFVVGIETAARTMQWLVADLLDPSWIESGSRELATLVSASDNSPSNPEGFSDTVPCCNPENTEPENTEPENTEPENTEP